MTAEQIVVWAVIYVSAISTGYTLGAWSERRFWTKLNAEMEEKRRQADEKQQVQP